MSLILAVLAQVGPAPAVPPISPLPPEIVERQRQERERRRAMPVSPPVARAARSGTLSQCLAQVASAPDDAREMAEAWLARESGIARAEAGHCLGVALSRLEQWDEAQSAFLAARDDVDSGDRTYRARLGAMAGNAALAAGEAAAALAALDAAEADLQAADAPELKGQTAADRARALVMLGRESEAEAALSAARQAMPTDAQVWLLSATLSRRLGKLAEAQARIEKAAELLPTDPAIGLEAGLIAMLSGREESARKSWQSVVEAAPESDAADVARMYLAQIDIAPEAVQ